MDILFGDAITAVVLGFFLLVARTPDLTKQEKASDLGDTISREAAQWGIPGVALIGIVLLVVTPLLDKVVPLGGVVCLVYVFSEYRKMRKYQIWRRTHPIPPPQTL